MSHTTPNSKGAGNTELNFVPAKIVYFNSVNPATATIFDIANPPSINNNSLKQDDQNLYTGSDSSLWRYNTATGLYETYVFPVAVKHMLFVRKASTQSVASESAVIAWDTPVSNTAGASAFNAATGTFTCQRAGYYSSSARLNFASASWSVAGNSVSEKFMLNGVAVAVGRTEIQVSHTNQIAVNNTFAGPFWMAVGDTLKLNAAHGETTPRTISGGPTNNQWSIWEN